MKTSPRNHSESSSVRARLLDALYRGACDSRLLTDFLRELIAATSSRSARLLVMNPVTTQVRASLKLNIDDDSHRAYVDHFVNACPWRPELRHFPRGRLYSSYLDFSCKQRDYYRSEFFNDWARALDIHHGACGTVYANDRQAVQLLVQRTGGQGHYSTHDMVFLNALVPHVQQALHLAEQVAATQLVTAAAGHAAARQAPFFLLDERSRLVWASAQADEIAFEGGALQVRDGRLRARDPHSDQRLQPIVRRALRSARGGWDSAGGVVSLPRPDNQPLQLRIAPLHPELPGLQLAPSVAYAAVFLYDPARAGAVDPTVLTELYGLTETEARVAAAIAQGQGPQDIARAHGVGAETVRAQLKSVFRKTDTRRQNELARLLLSGAAAR